MRARRAPAGRGERPTRRERSATRSPRAGRAARGEPAAAPVTSTTATAPAAPLRRRVAHKLLSAGALLFSAALVVGMTVPTSVFELTTAAPAVAASAPQAAGAADVQKWTTQEGAALAVARDDYTVTTYQETVRAKYGNRSYDYSTTWSGPVRWPFPYPVTITSGFGGRSAPCYGCSSMHMGLDFTPGGGTPIYAAADGVVSVHQSSGPFGNHVEIEHVINGQRITTLYAHMQYGSSPLNPGQPITAGDFIGLVGSTGASTGSHLHFEVHVDGTPVDPYAWLKANAG